MQAGYPVELPNGLHGFFYPDPSTPSIDIYFPQSRLMPFEDGTERGMVLSIDIEISPHLPATLKSIALALLSSVTVVPPSRQTTQGLPETFDTVFPYVHTYDMSFHPNPLFYSPLSHLLYGTFTFHRSLAPGFLFVLEPNGTYFQILHSFAPLHPDFV